MLNLLKEKIKNRIVKNKKETNLFEMKYDPRYLSFNLYYLKLTCYYSVK
jgi:hypothetical protein